MPSDLESMLQVFSVVGGRVEVPATSRFRFCLVPDWPTPSFSPLILVPGETMERSDLSAIERYFGDHPIVNPYVSATPYFNYLKGEGLYDEVQMTSILEGDGWVREENSLAVNLMRGVAPSKLPANLCTLVSSFAEGGLPSEYKELLWLGFNADDKYLALVEEVYAKANADTRTVMLRHADGDVVAAGTVSIRGKCGFFTWGTVHPAYRDRGFHRFLLQACRSVAVEAGARTCALTTRNPRIRARCEEIVELVICRKQNAQVPQVGAVD